MKFSDVRPGMLVAFDQHNSRRWASFHEDLIRSPNYHGPENWFITNFSKFEGIPLRVTQVATVNFHGSTWQVIRASSSQGIASLSEYWFDEDDEGAFREIVNKKLMEQIRTAPNPSARTKKNLTMGELKAVPGAVDYNVAAERFGKGRRKTRRGRKSLRTRKH
jgi:hypothetical protein